MKMISLKEMNIAMNDEVILNDEININISIFNISLFTFHSL